MAQYTAIFTKPYEDGYENLPSQNTPITAETLNDKDNAIVNIETYLSENDIPSDAEELSYDNTDSGLTADNVQGAVDELADEKVDKTGVDVKTNTTGQFNTITGGLMQSCIVNLEPIQSGSGTPSPQNVRPITGHSSVEVENNAGKNLFNGNWQYGLINTTTGEVSYNTYVKCTNFIKVNPSEWYILSSYGQNNTINVFAVFAYDVNKNYIGTVTVTVVDNTTAKFSEKFQMPSNAEYFRMHIATDTMGSAYQQLEQGEVVTDYVPYNGKTYTISLGQTVYSGSLDVVSGVLTVDRAYAEFDGSNDENWGSASGTGYHQYGISINDAKNSTTAITNRFSLIELSDRGNKTGLVSIENDTIFRFALKDSDLLISDVNAWKTWLSSNSLQVAYELATPLTIQLTPQQIETLIGQNNISVPLEGQSLDSLSYREMMAWDDVKTGINSSIEQKIKTAEFTETTSANGSFVSTLPSTAKVMSAYCTNASTFYIVMPFVNQYSPSYWSFHLREAEANNAVVASTSVTIKVNYMD